MDVDKFWMYFILPCCFKDVIDESESKVKTSIKLGSIIRIEDYGGLRFLCLMSLIATNWANFTCTNNLSSRKDSRYFVKLNLDVCSVADDDKWTIPFFLIISFVNEIIFGTVMFQVSGLIFIKFFLLFKCQLDWMSESCPCFVRYTLQEKWEKCSWFFVE